MPKALDQAGKQKSRRRKKGRKISTSNHVEETSSKLLSPNKAGKILNMSGETIKHWIRTNKLPATKQPNGWWKIKLQDLEEYLKIHRTGGRRRILLVDDDNQKTNAMASDLELTGHQVIVANSTLDGLIKASNIIPSLAVICVSMDSGKGWKLVKKIRNAKSIGTIPILVTSNKNFQDEDEKNALENKVVGFLKKPIKPSIIHRELERIFSGNLGI